MNERSVKSAIALTILALVLIGLCEGCPRTTSSGKRDVASKKIVARVGGAPVYEGDVNRRLLAAYGEIDRTTLPATRWQMMVEAATDSEILDRLLLRAARAEGMVVSNDAVDGLVQKSRQQLGEQNFAKMLNERKASETEFRAFLEERELIEQYKAKLFRGITVDQKALRGYFSGHAKDFAMSDSARIEVIVTPARETADDLYGKWKGGESFDSLSEKAGIVDGQPAARRLRFTPYDAMPPEIGPKVKAAANGTILPPVESGKRFYVVRVLEKRTARPMTFEEAKEDVRRALMAKKQQDILEQWQEKEREKVKVEYVR